MGDREYKYKITAPDYHHINPDRPLELTRMKTWKFRTLRRAKIKQAKLAADVGTHLKESAYPITRIKKRRCEKWKRKN